VVIFDIPITDTLATYNVYVNIRNIGDYPYQNLWFFLNKKSPDSVLIKDSIECYLADNRGKWLGKGVGSIFEMPVLYQQKVHFKNAGNYQYKIVHGMRDTILVGINDIGMRVEKVK
ncbi:MAG: gliding motility lipoprotein GldH, partial [Paludibacter sp.]